MTMSDAELLDALRRVVTEARAHLDTGQGVKLLYSDVHSLSSSIWTVGLQPGGSHAEHDQWCREPGAHDYRDGYRASAVVRPRGLQLRRQLDLMILWLGIDWRDTLSLNLVPFRSARWEKQPLRWREAALDFARNHFWPLLVTHRQPRLVIAFSKDVAQVLRSPALFGHRTFRTYPTGWGVYTADISDLDGTTLLRLPHLSTFKIFTRPECREPLARIRSDSGLIHALLGVASPVK